MKYGVFVATPRGCQQALRLVQALNHRDAGEYQNSYESLQGESGDMSCFDATYHP